MEKLRVAQDDGLSAMSMLREEICLVYQQLRDGDVRVDVKNIELGPQTKVYARAKLQEELY